MKTTRTKSQITDSNIMHKMVLVVKLSFCFVSSQLFLFIYFFVHFFLAFFIAAASIVSISLLVCDSSIVATCPSIPVPALLFVCVLFVLFLLFVVVLSGEPKQNQGRGLVDRKLVQAPQ